MRSQARILLDENLLSHLEKGALVFSGLALDHFGLVDSTPVWMRFRLVASKLGEVLESPGASIYVAGKLILRLIFDHLLLGLLLFGIFQIRSGGGVADSRVAAFLVRDVSMNEVVLFFSSIVFKEL